MTYIALHLVEGIDQEGRVVQAEGTPDYTVDTDGAGAVTFVGTGRYENDDQGRRVEVVVPQGRHDEWFAHHDQAWRRDHPLTPT